MGVIRKKNPQTGQWEIYGSTDAKDINLIDVNDNFNDKNVEGALKEVSSDLKKTIATINAQTEVLKEHTQALDDYSSTLEAHSEDIEWLKAHGGGGGGGGGGTSAPTITSSFESGTIVDKDTDIIIPIFFSSPNLGRGVAYVAIDGIEVMSIEGIKQGNNNVNIGKLSNLKNSVSIYVKDRANALSNQLTWEIICGGLDVELNFDYNADYSITDIITMSYKVTSASSEPITMHLTIDYDTFEVSCNQGYNEYIFSGLEVGVHKVSFYLTSGPYSSKTYNFNLVIISSTSLYVSSAFEGGSFTLGTPVSIDYRISKLGSEEFTVFLKLNGELVKTMIATAGSYYWTIPDAEIGSYEYEITVESAFNESITIEGSFNVIPGAFTPLQIITSGLTYRLNAKGRTNNDSDRDHPRDNSGNGVTTTLHDFNFYTNGWINDSLVCNGNAYVEINSFPFSDNAIYGSTIEIQFTGLDIGIEGARIFDYTDTNAPFKGVYVDLEEATMKSLANTGTISLYPGQLTTLSFVIDRSNKFGKIYINGVCSRAFSLSDSGSGVNAVREDFTHSQKIFLNSRKGLEKFGACEIKDIRIYSRTLSHDEILQNYIAQESDLQVQESLYRLNYENVTLPVIRMYGDTTNMTLETPVQMRIKYTSPNEDKYGQSFDLPYCQVNWQGTSSLQYVLKNFTVRLKDESMSDYLYTPYPDGILENVYCFKADYMESSHSRNAGIAKFVNECLYDSKNPAQLKNPSIRNSINGFPCLLYINDELQGVYNFNLDRYSTKSYGYTDESKCLVYEVSANSDTTAGAFYKWTESSGKTELDYYKSDFECLYPPTRAAGNDNMSELIRLIEWVDNSSEEDFRDNIGNYFNLEYLLRYYLFVYVFGAVDSLGKNMKLTSWDGLIWYPQVYDADTTIGLDNTGFLKFNSDIEMGDENVFNTTGSKLWQKVRLLFQPQLEEQYSLMRQSAFTIDNMMKYLVDEQISKIPAYYYNQDMQTKYLNFGSAYLYALHGNCIHHIRKWLTERLVYCDTLFGYNVSTSDYITLRSSKLGEVYLDIQTYIPMYVRVKWRDEAGGTGIQIKRVGKGETVRFSYIMPTATDQEIIVYAGHYLKSLGDVSNLQPTTMLIANADRLTEIICHSPNLINTDLSECTLLQKIDLSDSIALGTGIGSQPILNIQDCKYLRYCNCHNTQLTAIYTMQQGGNLEEIYYPSSVQLIQLTNQTYLHTVGVPYDIADLTTPQSLANVEITNCKNITKLCYPYDASNSNQFACLKYVQNLILNNSLDFLKSLSFKGFSKLRTLSLDTMPNMENISFSDMLSVTDSSDISNIKLNNCPLIKDVRFNITNDFYKIEFAPGCIIDFSGLNSLITIESNASIKGLDTIVLPLSIKSLKFTASFGDGKNEIRRILSPDSSHLGDDTFDGMDLKNIRLSYLDMSSLTISNAINFHLAPTDKHPNLNTFRDGVEIPYFRPKGSLDLTNYTGDIKYMFKGLDLDVFAIVPPSQSFANVTDLTSLFEGANVKNIDLVNRILSKYPYANNLNRIFKNSTITDASEIVFPSYKFSLKEGFMGSSLKEDFDIPLYVSDLTSCFESCRDMKKIRIQWEQPFIYADLITLNCFYDCININIIGSGIGTIKDIPTDWGGHAFTVTNIGLYTIETLEDYYEVTLGDLVDDGIIDWGDGSYSYGTNKHTFKDRGVYTIEGKVFPNTKGNEPDKSFSDVLVVVKNIPALSDDFSNMFSGCQILRIVELASYTFEFVIKTDAMFKNCRALVTPPVIDFTNITSANQMYYGCVGILALGFKNLCSESFICDEIISECLSLTDITFIGNTKKDYAKAIIDILDAYIKDNSVSEANLAEDVTSMMLFSTIMYEYMGAPILLSDEPQLSPLDSLMIPIYHSLVQKDLKSLDEVPLIIRPKVIDLLKKGVR